MNEEKIMNRLMALPDSLKRETHDFIEFLTHKHNKKMADKQFKFDWEGGLSELKHKYTSVELQHGIREWR